MSSWGWGSRLLPSAAHVAETTAPGRSLHARPAHLSWSVSVVSCVWVEHFLPVHADGALPASCFRNVCIPGLPPCRPAQRHWCSLGRLRAAGFVAGRIQPGSSCNIQNQVCQGPLNPMVLCRMCWRVIAQELNTGRTSKQCREHYLNSLRPNMKKGGWTQREEVSRRASRHIYSRYLHAQKAFTCRRLAYRSILNACLDSGSTLH